MILVLPHSSSDDERVFSIATFRKNKYASKLKTKSLSAYIHCKQGFLWV